MRAFESRGERKRQSAVRCFESLESRLVLSVAGPTVSDVNVSSTSWNSEFVDYLEANSLGTGGYSVPVGDSAQLSPLPWSNIDQVHITFSEDVDVQAADLSVSGVTVTAYGFSGFAYDSQSFTATWTLSQGISGDRIMLDLNGEGLDPVANLAGNVLDGEWYNEYSVYNSGNTIAGGDFEFRFDVLPGDPNQSGVVTGADYTWTWFIRGKTVEDSGYDHLRDIDGSGAIEATDYGFILGELFSEIPEGDPAGTTNDAPTTSGFANVQVDEDAADEVLSLFGAFDDLEDPYSGLTYEVISNSNAALFDATAVDEVLGTLTLDFAANAFGSADLVIRATDGGGLFVETTLHVDVASVNDAPVISDFVGVAGLGNIWTFSGTVTDVDDDPTNWIVYFFGVLEGKTSIIDGSDGYFELVIELDPSIAGDAWVQTEDDENTPSNTPIFYVSAV